MDDGQPLCGFGTAPNPRAALLEELTANEGLTGLVSGEPPRVPTFTERDSFAPQGERLLRREVVRCSRSTEDGSRCKVDVRELTASCIDYSCSPQLG